MTVGEAVIALALLMVFVMLGMILINIDDVMTTLRLIDVACP